MNAASVVSNSTGIIHTLYYYVAAIALQVQPSAKRPPLFSTEGHSHHAPDYFIDTCMTQGLINNCDHNNIYQEQIQIGCWPFFFTLRVIDFNN